MLSQAIALAKRGMAVLPLRPREKRPASPNGVKDATTDLGRIREWWRMLPDANIGIATGAVSGVFVLDIDGMEAEGELRQLEDAHGTALPSTVEAITARGRHCYFKMPTVDIRNSAGVIAPGLDVRASGGFIVSPPSVHPCGRRYAWSVDSASVFAPAPVWLLKKIAATHSGNGHAISSGVDWRALAAGGVDEGARDSTLTRMAGLLLRRYVDAHVVFELLSCWNELKCRPPLPLADVERIVASIAHKEQRRRQP